MGVCLHYVVLLFVYFVSSPYLLVIGDDHVTCCMGAYDISSGASDAYSRRWASMGNSYRLFLLSCK